jgi:hypothetical protein
MATRRTTNAKFEVPVPNGKSATANLDSSKATSSPWLPSALEGVLFLVYPLILILGSLYSNFDPSTRNATYVADSQSYDPRTAPSYFAKKSNILNVYFVKVGWLWATASFLLLIVSHPSFGPSFDFQVTRRRAQATLRFLSITTVWIFLTQWFFGPPIIDRSYRWTGGQCAMIQSDSLAAQQEKAEMGDAELIFTHAACKAIGGAWTGGHDISGHVFLLILCSAMLWQEFLPAVLRSWGQRDARSIAAADGTVKSAAAQSASSSVTANQPLGVGIQFAMGVVGLSLWMLLMTAVYFHTWFEKLTGFLVALTAIYVVYFVPRAIPVARSVLGVPGL